MEQGLGTGPEAESNSLFPTADQLGSGYEVDHPLTPTGYRLHRSPATGHMFVDRPSVLP